MTITDFTTVLSLTLLAILFYYLKPFLSKKAKNLADKQDIEELTQKVNLIEKSIDFNKQSKLSLATEERSAIIECYKKMLKYAELIKKIPPIPNLPTETDISDEFYEIRNKAYNDFVTSMELMNLFNLNSDIVKEIVYYRKELLQLEKIQNKYISNCKFLSLEYKNVIFEEGKFNEDKAKNFSSKKDKLTDDYLNELLSKMENALYPIENNIASLIHNRIKKLLTMDSI